MSAPRLRATAQIWRNRRTRITRHQRVAALLMLTGFAALLITERTAWIGVVQWLASHALWCAGLAAFFGAVAVAQRRSINRTQFPRSWLAAVPVNSSTARWEGFLLDSLPACAALAVVSLLALLSLTMAFAQSLGFKAIATVWAHVSGGIALGLGISFLIPVPKPVTPPPGSRYVPKAKTRRAAAIRPSFSALGRWPIRQMFAWAQPKLVARATIPVLLMMPMGTTADAAMIVIALFGVLFAMSLLCTALASVSLAARGWLAPLPVREAAIMRAFLLPAWGVIAGAGAMEALLLLLFNVAYGLSVGVGAVAVAMAVAVACASIGIAVWWNMRPKRMP